MLQKLSNLPTEHIATLKHVGDAASLGAVIALVSGIMVQLTPIVSFLSACAALVWFTFRAIDMYFTVKDHFDKRKAKTSVRNPSD